MVSIYNKELQHMILVGHLSDTIEVSIQWFQTGSSFSSSLKFNMIFSTICTLEESSSSSSSTPHPQETYGQWQPSLPLV